MSEKSKSTGGSISFCGAIFLVFLTLKLIGVSAVATWSWWWIFAPLWLPFALVIIVVLIISIFKSI